MILQWLPDGCQLVFSPVLPSVYDQTQVKNDEKLFPSLSFKLLLMGGEWSHDHHLAAMCIMHPEWKQTSHWLLFNLWKKWTDKQMKGGEVEIMSNW